MKQKARQANMELLRIIAMCMVVVLHYLIKGEAAVSLVENFTALNIVLWLVKAFCIVTINVYVLLSGYFLLEAKWKVSRLFEIWFQVLFYSVGVPAFCRVFGIGEVRHWGVYDWLNVLFPVQMEHYWFITAYVVMYLLIPVLSIGVKGITRKQHQFVIAGLLMVFSIPKSILPIYIPTDRYGYDFGWFICLFVIAAYLRLYGIPFLNSKKKAFTIYLVSAIGIWGISVVCAVLARNGLPFVYMMDMAYCYNHLLVLAASVALFSAFTYVKVPQGKFSEVVCRIAPYTLGVYLLHENLAVRTKWQFFAGIEHVRDGFEIFPHMVVTVIAVFVAGVLVDFVRDCIFKTIARAGKIVFAGKNAKK